LWYVPCIASQVVNKLERFGLSVVTVLISVVCSLVFVSRGMGAEELLPPPSLVEPKTCTAASFCKNNKRQFDWVSRAVGADLVVRELVRIGVLPGHTTVAVVDSGFDFANRSQSIVSPEVKLMCSGSECIRTDLNGHGTSVAGMISGKDFGVAPDVSLLVVPAGSGDTTNWTILVKDEELAILRACEAGAEVINVSYSSLEDEVGLRTEWLMPETIDELRKKGCLLVRAAGNSSLQRDVGRKYFDSDDALLRVEATNWAGSRSSISSAGEILAPGEDVFTLATQKHSEELISDKYFFDIMGCESQPHGYFTSGTSVAAPVVAAIAAQVMGVAKVHGLWSILDASERVKWTNRVVLASRLNNQINALRAVTLADAVAKDWVKKKNTTKRKSEFESYVSRAFAEKNLMAAYKVAVKPFCTSALKNLVTDCSATNCEEFTSCLNQLRKVAQLCDGASEEQLLKIADQLAQAGWSTEAFQVTESARAKVEKSKNRRKKKKLDNERFTEVEVVRERVRNYWAELVTRFSVVGPMLPGQDPELGYYFKTDAAIGILELAIDGFSGDSEFDAHWFEEVLSILRSSLNSYSSRVPLFEQNPRLTTEFRSQRQSNGQREQMRNFFILLHQKVGAKNFIEVVSALGEQALLGFRKEKALDISSYFALSELLLEIKELDKIKSKIAANRKVVFQAWLATPATVELNVFDYHVGLALFADETEQILDKVKLYGQGKISKSGLGEGFCEYLESQQGLLSNTWVPFVVKRTQVVFETGTGEDKVFRLRRTFVLATAIEPRLPDVSKQILQALEQLLLDKLDSGLAHHYLYQNQWSFCATGKIGSKLQPSELYVNQPDSVTKLLLRLDDLTLEVHPIFPKDFSTDFKIAASEASLFCLLGRSDFSDSELEGIYLKRLRKLTLAWSEYADLGHSLISKGSTYSADEMQLQLQELDRRRSHFISFRTRSEYGWLSNVVLKHLPYERLRNFGTFIGEVETLYSKLELSEQFVREQPRGTIPAAFELFDARELKKALGLLLSRPAPGPQAPPPMQTDSLKPTIMSEDSSN